MTHCIIVVYIHLDSDLLRFGCVNYFIVLGWLRLFRKKVKINKSQQCSLALVEVMLHILCLLPFIYKLKF